MSYICKNIFVVHRVIGLWRQVNWWLDKYLSKYSLVKRICDWRDKLNGCSHELRSWKFVYINWFFQYVFEWAVFFRLFKSLICGPCPCLRMFWRGNSVTLFLRVISKIVWRFTRYTNRLHDFSKILYIFLNFIRKSRSGVAF